MAQVVVLHQLGAAATRELGAFFSSSFPDVQVHQAHSERELHPYIDEADVFMGTQLTPGFLDRAQKLAWIQVLESGTQGVMHRNHLRPQTAVTNIHGISGPAMSEAVTMYMLALARNLPGSIRMQDACEWRRFPASLLKGKTVGILGMGSVAMDLATICKAFGMSVVGYTAKPERASGGFSRIEHRSSLLEEAPELDFLVVLLPLNIRTRHFVDAQVIGAMKPSAFLVNVGYAGVVDENALRKALVEKRIAGAAVDVFESGPLTRGHPFWDLKNLIVTPHTAGFSEAYPSNAFPVLAHNMRRYLAKDVYGMWNIVRPPKS